MARSGSSEITFGSFIFRFNWEIESSSVVNNTTTISWWTSFISTGSIYGFAQIGSNPYWAVMVEGQEYTGTANIDLSPNSEKTLASGISTISHNSDGNRTFVYTFTQDFQLEGLRTGSGYGELDTIPKSATITSATDFNDEENPTITYSNPSGTLVDKLEACISVNGAKDDVPYREISKTGTSYTFELTEEERAELRRYIVDSTSITVRFYVKTTRSGYVTYSYITKTLTLINYEPTLAPRVVATDARTKELTGDSAGGTLIKYISDVAFNTRAVGNKEAVITYQTIICGSTTLEDYTSNTGTIMNVDSNTFYFSASDSRGYITRDALVFSEDEGKFIPYFKLTNNIRQTTLTFNGDLTFIIGGKYFDGSFGAKNNTLEVEFMLQDADGYIITNTSGSGWQALGTVTPETDGEGNYTFEYTISGLDHEMQYTLTVNAIDELTPVQSSTTVISVVPVFEWGKSDFRFNVPVYLKDSEEPLTVAADFVVEQGTSGTWYYRKWNSGRAELYGYQNVSDIACTAALGNMYRTAVITPPSFPFTVYSPKIVATYESEGYGAFLWPTTLTTIAKPFNYYLVRPTSSTGITGKVNFHIQGEWE